MSALRAFEAASEHLNFSKAAESLNTSQSAISRHIAQLEARLCVTLFDRSGKRLSLTPQGTYFASTLDQSLETLRYAISVLQASANKAQISIACSHEISHLYLLPRFDALRAHLGSDIQVQVLTYEYDLPQIIPEQRADIILGYGQKTQHADDLVSALPETIQIVCSASFKAHHAATLDQPLSRWADIPFLRLAIPNHGWTSWDDWFTRFGASPQKLKFEDFTNYVYLLEAASAGRGVALGWIGLIDRYVENGFLVPLTVPAHEFDGRLSARLTTRGRAKPAAIATLHFLEA